jgi:predicted Co/Zn/Cd cation transporter (cation efflux family)
MTIRGLTGLLSLIILGIGIYTGMRSIKSSNSQKLTYGQAVLAGFIIALTTGIITALVGLVYCNIINSGYTAYMIAESKKAMTVDGKSPAEVAAAMPALQQQWSTGGQMLQALIGQTICGTIIALILGIFIKSKK